MDQVNSSFGAVDRDRDSSVTLLRFIINTVIVIIIIFCCCYYY